mmetsp:Transcript_61239/g.169500  ORF Transcript_61239/g.169500 Transcript_61239/m.169500 type:complete len:87 (+) Transcript_61239:62-322(+)
MAAAAPSDKDLEAKKGGLNKVETKTGGGEDEAAIAHFAGIFDKHSGDLDAIFGELGDSEGLALAKAKPPADGAAFAKAFLAGHYSA